MADWGEVARTACDVHHASQHQDELADVLVLVADLAPTVIVEIGCDRGGTLYAWRQVCQRVYGITSADNSHAAGGSGGPLDSHGATVQVGDSHDPATFDWLTGQLDSDPVDVLVLDGDHTYDGVSQDFTMYAPLVRPGGLVLLHDIAVTNDPRAQVYRFWPELVERWPDTVEICSAQHTPYGWGVLRWT